MFAPTRTLLHTIAVIMIMMIMLMMIIIITITTTITITSSHHDHHTRNCHPLSEDLALMGPDLLSQIKA
jgi:hypothetical protein